MMVRGQCFTYTPTDGRDPITVSIDALELRVLMALLSGDLDCTAVYIDPDQARFILADGDRIDHDHLATVDLAGMETPLFFCAAMDGEGTHTLVDGSHRFVKAWQDGVDTLPSVLIPPAIWQECVVPTDIVAALNWLNEVFA